MTARPTTARRFDGFSAPGVGLAQRLDRQHLGGPAGRDQRGDDGDAPCRPASEIQTVRGSICSDGERQG